MPTLVVFDPDRKTHRKVHIDKDSFTIGRSVDADLRLPTPSVSKKHAVVERKGARFTFRDLESRNGVELNGFRTKHGSLSDGDELRIGGMVITFFREALPDGWSPPRPDGLAGLELDLQGEAAGAVLESESLDGIETLLIASGDSTPPAPRSAVVPETPARPAPKRPASVAADSAPANKGPAPPPTHEVAEPPPGAVPAPAEMVDDVGPAAVPSPQAATRGPGETPVPSRAIAEATPSSEAPGDDVLAGEEPPAPPAPKPHPPAVRPPPPEHRPAVPTTAHRHRHTHALPPPPRRMPFVGILVIALGCIGVGILLGYLGSRLDHASPESLAARQASSAGGGEIEAKPRPPLGGPVELTDPLTVRRLCLRLHLDLVGRPPLRIEMDEFLRLAENKATLQDLWAEVDGRVRPDAGRLETSLPDVCPRLIGRPASPEEHQSILDLARKDPKYYLFFVTTSVEYCDPARKRRRTDEQLSRSLYVDLLDRAPTDAEAKGVLDALHAKDGGLTKVAELIVRSDRALSGPGSQQPPESWIRDGYARFIQRAPSADEEAAALVSLRAGAEAWRNILLDLASRPEYLEY